ncbi:hypothetical protein EI981_07075 [Paenibacillus lutimineralis]|uniref:Uncharacterized protein n=2 Tax=Paenibacillus lutimineralis TaxID=2707005 RepID=A0A3Q9IFZ1_9BACL|nr:hypothetical protein EI981_07075 [Paenibacillus lutimineralis]
MLNDNWDKIDAAMGQVDIPDATLTVKGKVQLSSATDSAAEDRAATPKAVKDAALQAKSYTDQQISLVTETGIPKLVSYPLLVTATADNQKVFEIPLDLFDANTDTLLVAINRAVLDATQYTVTNTVLDGAGKVTQRAKLNLLSGVAAASEVTMVVLKNVPIGSDGAINGAVLATGSVPINRVDGLQQQLDLAFQAGNERKKEVVDALIALGVSASTVDSWDTLIGKISTIIRATGNAVASDVRAGMTFSNASGNNLIGTMPKFSPGDHEIYRDGGRAASQPHMVKLYTVEVSGIQTSILRVSMVDLGAYSEKTIAHGQIYVNGLPRGILRSVPGGYYKKATFVEDITCQDQDTIELWVRSEMVVPGPTETVSADLKLSIDVPATKYIYV